MNKRKYFLDKAFICGSPWGIGIYKTVYGDPDGTMYGFPPSNMNPNDFCPDRECCTDKEIESWTIAKEKWNNGRTTE